MNLSSLSERTPNCALEESFQGAYLTLVGIIQGLALAILVQEWPSEGQALPRLSG